MKNYLTIATAALMLAACSSDGTETEQAVTQSGSLGFEVTVGESTRAVGALNDLDAVKATGIGVFGLYTGSVEYKYKTVTPDFMHNQKVEWFVNTSDPSKSTWTYSPVKYWPNVATDMVTFFAYAPYEKEPGATKCIAKISESKEQGDPWLIYQLATDPFNLATPTDDADNQVDLLYATEVNTTDPGKPGAPLFDIQRTNVLGDKVQMQFNHALACSADRIDIKISDALKTKLDDYKYAKVYIYDVAVNFTHLTQKGKLVLNCNGSPNWQEVISDEITTSRSYTVNQTTLATDIPGVVADASYDAITEAAALAYYTANAGLTTSPVTVSTGKGLFIIPIKLSGESQVCTITVKYQIITNNGKHYEGTATSDEVILDNLKPGSIQNIVLTLNDKLQLKHKTFLLTGPGASGPSYAPKH